MLTFSHITSLHVITEPMERQKVCEYDKCIQLYYVTKYTTVRSVRQDNIKWKHYKILQTNQDTHKSSKRKTCVVHIKIKIALE